MTEKKKLWYGPLYLLEGFLFATGCFTKNHLLTFGAVAGACGTTIADIHARKSAVREARKESVEAAPKE